MDHLTRILIVDRDPVAAEALQHMLAGHGYDVAVTHSPSDVIDLLEREKSARVEPPIGVVIADQDAVGAGPGLGLIRELHDGWPAVVPVVVSAFRKVESAVAVMRLGAADYLLKPVVEIELIDAVQRAEQRHVLLQGTDAMTEPDVDELEQEPAEDAGTDSEPAQQAVLAKIEGDETWTPMPLAEAMKGPERRILLAALEANDWNRQKTAKQLDINRTTLYKKIRQYRLDEPA